MDVLNFGRFRVRVQPRGSPDIQQHITPNETERGNFVA